MSEVDSQVSPEGPLQARYRAAVELAQLAPRPVVVDNVTFGTAGWTDPSLLSCRAFYPPGTQKPQARLEYYAQHFSMVEVDATYYTILTPSVSSNWLAWTPETFQFNIKAHSSMTGHPVDLSRLPKVMRERWSDLGRDGRAYPRQLPRELLDELWLGFEAFIRPLADAGRLGCIMLQFPPWFTATRGNVRHLERLRERWRNYLVSIEFRHPSWLAEERRERVFDLLQQLEYAYVVVDEPNVRGGGVPPVVRVTNPQLALFRFHGHNSGAWQRRGASVAERFDYLYAPEELSGWARSTLETASQAERVHAVFNNCVRDYAVVNAKDLGILVQREAARQAELELLKPSV